MHSEFLIEVAGKTAVQIELRFLHLVTRQVWQSVGNRLDPVVSLTVDDRVVESWDEGVERSVEFEVMPWLRNYQEMQFGFPASYRDEWLRDTTRQTVGRLSRTQHPVKGSIRIAVEGVRETIKKLKVDITNQTGVPSEERERNGALLRSLVSAHTILTIKNGEFVSLLDPPENLQDEVKGCKNIGNFPVLVGSENERDMLLCSPIVLYDYPRIAPESAGDFYDATEMDEMLTLRVMTLTDEEKNEMRLADDRVRNLLQRTEQSARDQLMRTHGAIRGMRSMGGSR
jgi:hydrogenase maturation protease